MANPNIGIAWPYESVDKRFSGYAIFKVNTYSDANGVLGDLLPLGIKLDVGITTHVLSDPTAFIELYYHSTAASKYFGSANIYLWQPSVIKGYIVDLDKVTKQKWWSHDPVPGPRPTISPIFSEWETVPMLDCLLQHDGVDPKDLVIDIKVGLTSSQNQAIRRVFTAKDTRGGTTSTRPTTSPGAIPVPGPYTTQKPEVIPPTDTDVTFMDIFNSELPVATGLSALKDSRVEVRAEDVFDYTNIGYTAFYLPPNSISVSQQHEIQSVDVMRSNTSTKQMDTKLMTQVNMNFTINGTEEFDVVVRSLLEQFRRCPFLPVHNYTLNEAHEIEALALRSMSVSTTPGYPGMFDININADPFEWTAYMPKSKTDYDGLFCYPLFQMWCKTRFKAKRLPQELSGKLLFKAANVDSVEAQKEMGGLVLDTPQPFGASTDQGIAGLINNVVESYNNSNITRVRSGIEIPNITVYKEAGSSEPMVAVKLYSLVGAKFMVEEALRSGSRVKVASKFTTAQSGKGAAKQINVSGIKYVELDEQTLRTLTVNLTTWSANNGPGHTFSKADQYVYIFPYTQETVNRLINKVTHGFAPPSTKPIIWDEFDLSDIIIVEGITTQFANNIATLHPRTGAHALHQFMGGMDASISIAGYVYGTDNLKAITDVLKHLQALAKRFRAVPWGMDTVGYLEIDNEIVNAQGIEFAVPISINYSTVEGYPELYNVKLDLVQFRDTQRQNEAASYLNPKVIEWLKSSEGREVLRVINNQYQGSVNFAQLATATDLSDILPITRVDNPAVRWAHSTIQKLVIQQIEAYPDLELPTKREYNEWVDAIQNHIKKFQPQQGKSTTKEESSKFDDILYDIIGSGSSVPIGDSDWNTKALALKKYKTTFGFCDPDFFVSCIDPANPTYETGELMEFAATMVGANIPTAATVVSDDFGAQTTSDAQAKSTLDRSEHAEPREWQNVMQQVIDLKAVQEAGEDLSTGMAGMPAGDIFTAGEQSPQMYTAYPGLPKPYGADWNQATGLAADKLRGVKKWTPEQLNLIKVAVDTVNACIKKAYSSNPLYLDYGSVCATLAIETTSLNQSAGVPTGEGGKTYKLKNKIGYGFAQMEKPQLEAALSPVGFVSHLFYKGGLSNHLPMDHIEYLFGDAQKAMNLAVGYMGIGLQKWGHPVIRDVAHNLPLAAKYIQDTGSISGFKWIEKGVEKKRRDGIPWAEFLSRRMEVVRYVGSYINATTFGRPENTKGLDKEVQKVIAGQAVAGQIPTRWVYVVDVITSADNSEGDDNSPVNFYFNKKDGEVSDPKYKDLTVVNSTNYVSWDINPQGHIESERQESARKSYTVKVYRQELVAAPDTIDKKISFGAYWGPSISPGAPSAWSTVDPKEFEDSIVAVKQHYTSLDLLDAPNGYRWKAVDGGTYLKELPPTGLPNVTKAPYSIKEGPAGEVLGPSSLYPVIGAYVDYTAPPDADIIEGQNVDAGALDMMHSLFSKAEFGRLLRAYPTYVVMVIDGGRWVGRELLWPHFYGQFGIQAISHTRTREDPVDVATVSFANLYNRLTSIPAYNRMIAASDTRRNFKWTAWKDAVHQFFATNATEETEQRWEAFAKTMMIKPGARLHIRMGYGSNPYRLPVIFNGTISEVPVNDNVVQVVAIGDGAELVKSIPLTDDYIKSNKATGNKEWQNTGGWGTPKDPSRIISDIFRPTSWFKSYTFARRWYAENAYGICNFGNNDYHDLRLVGQGQERFGYENGEPMVNVYNTSSGSKPSTGYAGWWWVLTGLIAHLKGMKYFGISVSDPTPWKIIAACRSGVPDYVCAVRPFEFRSTIFFGRQDFPFSYQYRMEDRSLVGMTPHDPKAADSVTLAEREQVRTFLNRTLWEDVGDVTKRALAGGAVGSALLFLAAPITFPFSILTTAGALALAGVAADAVSTPPEHATEIVGMMPSAGVGAGALNPVEAQLTKNYGVMMDKKLFSQMHLIGSTHNLLNNMVSVSEDEVFTNVQCKYSYLGMTAEEVKQGDLMRADSDIYPEVQKTAVISTSLLSSTLHGGEGFGGLFGISARLGIAPVANAANAASVQYMRDSINKMYQGAFIIIGDPYFFPWDFAMVADHTSRMSGVIQVRAVTHEMSLDSGFVTAVEPDCVVLAQNDRMMSFLMTGYKICQAYLVAIAMKTATAAFLRRAGQSVIRTTATLLEWSGTPSIHYEGNKFVTPPMREMKDPDGKVIMEEDGVTPRLEPDPNGSPYTVGTLQNKHKELEESIKSATQELKKNTEDMNRLETELIRVRRTDPQNAELIANLEKAKTSVEKGRTQVLKQLGDTEDELLDLQKTLMAPANPGRWRKLVETLRTWGRKKVPLGNWANARVEATINSLERAASPAANIRGGILRGARTATRGTRAGLGVVGMFLGGMLKKDVLETLKVGQKVQLSNGDWIQIEEILGNGGAKNPELASTIKAKIIKRAAEKSLGEIDEGITLYRSTGSGRGWAVQADGTLQTISTLVDEKLPLETLRKSARQAYDAYNEAVIIARLEDAGEDIVGKALKVEAAQATLSAARMKLGAEGGKFLMATALKGIGAASSFFLKMAWEALTFCVGDWVTRQLAARQSVIIMPMRVAGLEFSAGINGHMGSVVGDDPSPEDIAFACFFNPSYAADRIGGGGADVHALAFIMELLIPWDTNAATPRSMESGMNDTTLFSPNMYIDRPVLSASSRWAKYSEAAPATKTLDTDNFKKYIDLMKLKAKLRKPDPNPTDSAPIGMGVNSSPTQMASTAALPNYGLRLPVADKWTQVTHGGFGVFRTSSNSKHMGVDLAIPMGTNIYAAAPGIVSEVVQSGTFEETGFVGRHIKINHNNYMETTYGHLLETLVKPGDSVLAGQLIGKSGGKTGDPSIDGRSYGAHLHFAVKVGGKYVDPGIY